MELNLACERVSSNIVSQMKIKCLISLQMDYFFISHMRHTTACVQIEEYLSNNLQK